ncbi:MAG: 4Fe-4S dicluster domain-containing protein [Bdellovibrionales bacterium]|nr:4Fe-4S dicluster domain-containing protein [Bdellovibrionales bacterium]
MSFSVRDGKLDVVVAAGPRVQLWPSAGIRSFASLCAEYDLQVGIYGPDTLSVRGLVPLSGTGAVIIAEDPQKRIHRIHARAVLRVAAPTELPDPFPGWRSQALIPLSTARRLQEQVDLFWAPRTVILGTSGQAFRFGSDLLSMSRATDATQVICVETHSQWGGKRFAGWEVDRRRFEMLGGKVIEGRPVSLSQKAPLLWEFRIQDAEGIRILEVARVVSAGPFDDFSGIKESPPGNLLFDLKQTSLRTEEEDFDGWNLEEERGRWLATRVIKGLVTELGSRKDDLERIARRAKNRIKRSFKHRDFPFHWDYQGKWTSAATQRAVRSFSGVPQTAQKTRMVASLECFEEIGCNLCEKVCPENAIRWARGQIQAADAAVQPVLSEKDCTGCGLCLPACPSSSILMIRDPEQSTQATLTFPWKGSAKWKAGDFATLVNRRGEILGTARVSEVQGAAQDDVTAQVQSGDHQWVKVEVPSHLAWEARGIRRSKVQVQASVAKEYAETQGTDRRRDSKDMVEITLDGEKRLIRDRVPITAALFEFGIARPEDVLYCGDGGCGLCTIFVDGVKRSACQTTVRKGMALRNVERVLGVMGDAPGISPSDNVICPCVGVKTEDVVERIGKGQLGSMEAVQALTSVGCGKCHGQVCTEALRRLLERSGVDAKGWSDWQFPWGEWTLAPTN